MGISFHAGKLDGDTMNMVGDRDLKLSERNAVILFDALGIVAESCGHIEIEKFLGIARSWLRHHIGKPSQEIQSREHRGDQGCTVIDLPLRAGYVNERVHQIVTMLADAKQQGATYVYWG